MGDAAMHRTADRVQGPRQAKQRSLMESSQSIYICIYIFIYEYIYTIYIYIYIYTHTIYTHARPTVCRSTPNQTAESNGKLAEYEAAERQVHEATRVEVHSTIAHELLLPSADQSELCM